MFNKVVTAKGGDRAKLTPPRRNSEKGAAAPHRTKSLYVSYGKEPAQHSDSNVWLPKIVADEAVELAQEQENKI
jgi:hypothetical protein